jgi:hypothetical protein
MNNRRTILAISAAVALGIAHGALAQAPAQQPTPQQRVAMLKQWLQASQGQLRAYEWIETTAVALKGEEKSSTQKSCYYGADGAIQKVPVGVTTGDDAGPRGPLRKKIAASKKEELTEYMQAAVALVHSYVPPDSSRIQQSLDAGKLSVNVLEPGRRIRLEFRDYLKAGDILGVDIELPTNRLLGMQVSSYMGTPDDPVTMNATMGVLPDGTIYTAKTVLEAAAKEMKVTVDNTGYRRTGG